MVTFDTLVDYCERDEWPVDVDTERRRIRSRFTGANGSFNVSMTVDEETEDVMFLVPFYLKVPPGETDDAIRYRLLELLLYVNYEIMLGNYEYDIGDGEVRYRLSLACAGSDFTFDMFIRCTKALMWTCDHYWPACQRVLWANLDARAAIDSLQQDKPADEAEGEAPQA